MCETGLNTAPASSVHGQINMHQSVQAEQYRKWQEGYQEDELAGIKYAG